MMIGEIYIHLYAQISFLRSKLKKYEGNKLQTHYFV